MDNSEGKAKRKRNSAKENGERRPEPATQASSDSNGLREEIQPAEILPAAKRAPSSANAILLPDQFAAGGAAVRTGPSANDIMESILRFKWTVAGIFVLVAAPAIAVIWTQIIPQYQAKAEVRVRPIIPRLVFRTDENGAIPFYDSFVNTQVSVMRIYTVLQRVLDQPEVQQTQWYKNPRQSLLQRLRGNTATPMERLKDALSAQPRRRTEIIDVSFTDPSAKEAKLIVDAVLAQYIQYTREMSDAMDEELNRQRVERYKSIENDIRGREKIAAQFRNSLGTENPQRLVSDKRIRLEEIEDRIAEVQRTIALLELQTKQAATGDGNDVPVVSTGEPKYHQDAEWRERDIEVRRMRHSIDNSLLTPKHPDMIRMTKDLEFAEEQLRRREAQLDEQWRNQPINTGVPITISGATGPGYRVEVGSMFPEQQLAQAKLEEQLLQAELEKQREDLKRLSETAQLLAEENSELEPKRELFDAIRQVLDEQNMERNVPGSTSLLTRALVPSRPYSDRRIVFTAMALIMGLGMGGGVAFLRASRSQAIYTPKDMPRPIQIPFLGHVPLISEGKARGKTMSRETEQNRFLMIESIRVMRTALLSRLSGQDSSTVLITSASTGTGKTSFTKMLGECMAQAGVKVLMIDADFHKMTLSKWFDLYGKAGFMDSLSCRYIEKRHIFPTEISGLSIMPAGKRGDGHIVFEEIANGAFKTCMSQLSEQHDYDIILLDSPPIVPVADATILASQVDGTILVERELVSRRADVANALIRLGSTGGRLFGTVFVGSGGHKGYGYDYYHSTAGKSWS